MIFVKPVLLTLVSVPAISMNNGKEECMEHSSSWQTVRLGTEIRIPTCPDPPKHERCYTAHEPVFPVGRHKVYINMLENDPYKYEGWVEDRDFNMKDGTYTVHSTAKELKTTHVVFQKDLRSLEVVEAITDGDIHQLTEALQAGLPVTAADLSLAFRVLFNPDQYCKFKTDTRPLEFLHFEWDSVSAPRYRILKSILNCGQVDPNALSWRVDIDLFNLARDPDSRPPLTFLLYAISMLKANVFLHEICSAGIQATDVLTVLQFTDRYKIVQSIFMVFQSCPGVDLNKPVGGYVPLIHALDWKDLLHENQGLRLYDAELSQTMVVCLVDTDFLRICEGDLNCGSPPGQTFQHSPRASHKKKNEEIKAESCHTENKEQDLEQEGVTKKMFKHNFKTFQTDIVPTGIGFHLTPPEQQNVLCNMVLDQRPYSFLSGWQLYAPGSYAIQAEAKDIWRLQKRNSHNHTENSLPTFETFEDIVKYFCDTTICDVDIDQHTGEIVNKRLPFNVNFGTIPRISLNGFPTYDHHPLVYAVMAFQRDRQASGLSSEPSRENVRQNYMGSKYLRLTTWANLIAFLSGLNKIRRAKFSCTQQRIQNRRELFRKNDVTRNKNTCVPFSTVVEILSKLSSEHFRSNPMIKECLPILSWMLMYEKCSSYQKEQKKRKKRLQASDLPTPVWCAILSFDLFVVQVGLDYALEHAHEAESSIDFESEICQSEKYFIERFCHRPLWPLAIDQMDSVSTFLERFVKEDPFLLHFEFINASLPAGFKKEKCYSDTFEFSPETEFLLLWKNESSSYEWHYDAALRQPQSYLHRKSSLTPESKVYLSTYMAFHHLELRQADEANWSSWELHEKLYI